MVVKRLRELIDAKQNFVFETTLSSKHSIEVMRNARKAGFEVALVFVALADPKENVKRVQLRVKLGGHDIPKADIIRRYEASLEQLAHAIQLAHETVVIDNSKRKPVWVFKVKGDALILPPGTGYFRNRKRNHFHDRLTAIARTVSSTFVDRMLKPKLPPKKDL